MRKAISAPICISPLSMRPAPNQMAATLDVLSTVKTIGNMNAISRPALSERTVRSSLVCLKRSASWGSRPKARTTRMPMICSRRTSLTRSIFSWMAWNCGIIRQTTVPTPSTRAGMATSSRSDSGPSSRMARIVPTTRVMGAAARIVSDITTRIWTCWTSLVIRVISEGAPNSPTSRAE